MKIPSRHFAKAVFVATAAFLLPGCTTDSVTRAAPAPKPVEVVPANPPAQVATNEDPDAETPVEAANGSVIEAPLNLSTGLSEIIKLSQARVGDEVILAYIEKTGPIFNPTVDEILYLNDLGVSQAVITELVKNTKKMDSVAKTEPTVKPDAAPAPVAPAAQVPAPVAEQTPLVVQPPAAIVSAPQEVQHFYGDLAPYGNWVYVADYGWSWQPAVAVIDTSWRPYYTRGRWLWTDAGWYWQSDYSWGWAAFHHGRWYRHNRFGWCWTPDLVWGPSWVSWRYADSHCGWAPLPPSARFRSGVGFTFHSSNVGVSFDFGLGYDSYCYVPTRYFCEPDPWRYGLSRHHGRSIHNHTTVINNYTVNNTTVINNGVGFNRISSVSRNEIRRVEVREQSRTERSSVRPDRVVPEGSKLAVYRPSSSPSSSSSRSSEVRRPGGSVAPASRPSTATSLISSASRPGTTSRASEPARPSETVSRPGSSTASKDSESSRPGSSINRTRPSTSVSRDESSSKDRPAEPNRPQVSSSRPSERNERPSEPTRPQSPSRPSETAKPSAPVQVVPAPQKPVVSTLPSARQETPRSSLDTGITPRPSRLETLRPPTTVKPPTTVHTPPTIPTPPQVVSPAKPSSPTVNTRPWEAQRPVENNNRPTEVRRPSASVPNTPAARPSFENRSAAPSYTPPSTPTRPSFQAPSSRPSSPSPSYSRPAESRPSAPAPSYSRPPETRSSPPPTSSAPPVRSSPPPTSGSPSSNRERPDRR